MLVKIDEIARKFEISPEELKNYLKKRHPELLQVIEGRFGSKEEAIDAENSEMLLWAFHKFEEEKERWGIWSEGIDKKEGDNVPSEEVYEYSIATILNKNWRIDLEKYVKVLNEKAKEGWRLCTVHTNELGKEARRILGFGAESIICEDALIFERRVLRETDQTENMAQP